MISQVSTRRPSVHGTLLSCYEGLEEWEASVDFPRPWHIVVYRSRDADDVPSSRYYCDDVSHCHARRTFNENYVYVLQPKCS